MKSETYFLRQALIRVAMTMLFFSVCRLLFYIFNAKILPTPSVLDFFYGLKFDLSAAMYVNILLWLTYLLPHPFRLKKGYVFFQKIVFIVSNFIAVGFELGDIGYFRFANRRMVLSDFDLIKNTAGMLPKLFAEHWYIVLLGIASLFIFNYLYKKTTLASPQKTFWLWQLLIFPIGVGIFIVSARGGLLERPLTPISSAEYASDMRLMPLVSNTTLNVIHSTGQKFLTAKTYMTDAEAERIYPIFTKPQTTDSFRRVNVVVIALESCGKEYSAFFNQKTIGYKGFTPFLDSIAQQSTYCENTFSNGLRSTQGVAAISTGLPSLMNDPFMFSPYQSNQLDGLGAHLKRKGYKTAFFHGAHRGSMDFNKFAPLTGFTDFYARDDYPKKGSDYDDGTWGIWDGPMFQFMLDKINATPQPFYSMIFTLTSHHPYAVPTWFEQKYPNLAPVNRATLYTDWALSQFFAEAKKQPWFDNTLFVFSADHSGVHSTIEEYQTYVGRYKIPILFYKPNEIKHTIQPRVGQQIDIVPSVLDFLHYNTPHLSFGRSIFAPPQYNEQSGHFYTFNFEEGVYQITDNRFALLFDGREVKGLFDYTKDILLKNNLTDKLPEETKRLEQVLKAVIQQHDKRMLNNHLIFRQ